MSQLRHARLQIRESEIDDKSWWVCRSSRCVWAFENACEEIPNRRHALWFSSALREYRMERERQALSLTRLNDDHASLRSNYSDRCGTSEALHKKRLSPTHAGVLTAVTVPHISTSNAWALKIAVTFTNHLSPCNHRNYFCLGWKLHFTCFLLEQIASAHKTHVGLPRQGEKTEQGWLRKQCANELEHAVRAMTKTFAFVRMRQ